MQRHLAAYRYAAGLAAGRTVLDAGCGEGYGAAMLAGTAARVLGLDQAEAIAIAQGRHRAANLTYRTYDLTRLAELGETFELVVSFQVIEHLHDPAGFLRGLAACTAPGGTLVFAVCSLEREEGEEQIAAFLKAHSDFERLPIKPDEVFGHDEWLTPEGDLRTLPFHLEGGMDGFYAARLRKL